ncbi:MAG: hypothetical protein WA418_40910 [Bradyrhizobium sp.]
MQRLNAAQIRTAADELRKTSLSIPAIPVYPDHRSDDDVTASDVCDTEPLFALFEDVA